MKQRPAGRPSSSEQIIRDIKRKTRKQYNAEEKIRIVLDGLRGEDSIAELCRREGIAQSLYYKWSKDFMEAGKRRLAGDIVRQANDVLRQQRQWHATIVGDNAISKCQNSRVQFNGYSLWNAKSDADH
tara:strand:+ start:82 stop:465 length:384 start_codon:yes stop_codon:yes gene_type:complete